jgi:phage terminase small subunit
MVVDMSKPTKHKRLTQKQLALVNALLTTEKISVEQAGIQVGYSAKTAAQIASRTMALPHVAAYYQAELAKRAERTGIDADYVLQRLAAIDLMDVADLYDDAGGLLPIKQWPLIWRQMVKEVDLKTGKIKLQDKLRTIELMGKHVGVRAFADQIEVKDTTGQADRMERAKQRARQRGEE